MWFGHISLPVLLVLPTWTASSTVQEVQVVTVIFGDALANGYTIQSPAYNVAFRQARLQYPDALANVTRHSIYMPGTFSCQESAALVPLLAMDLQDAIERHHGLSVLISPGCSLEVANLGDFARGNVAGDASLKNIERFPTVVSFASSDHNSLVEATLRLLELHAWSTVTLLCDDLTPGTLGGFSAAACRALTAGLAQNYPKFTPNIRHFNWQSAGMNQTDLIANMLERTQTESRVIVIFAATAVLLRRILIVAHRCGMSQGDYVFLTLIPPKAPALGTVDWRFGDAEDQVAFVAFQSLIVIHNPNANWGAIPDVLQEIANETESIYNRTLTAEQFRSDLTIAGYEVVTSLAEILNESHQTLDLISGTTFRAKFLNRTFNQRSRSFFIGDNGMRVCDVVLNRLNTTSGYLQVRLLTDSN
ncbi:hypothetical protein BV898_15191 [Hypsibius exemplaris]|uniref:Receptor ligand binding region domain-containing protein n=1 Tax=Hypsibius exemplaris TaxID=2072580 RepID=A0A9X6NHD3_HYPEX|nr:hypothetical protein BV898_15191 [Hypsibius exemplaris]